MKKEWVRPLAVVQNFVPNEYVACCEANEGYSFHCTTGLGWQGNVYEETNGIPGWQPTDNKLGRYHACGAWHKGSDSEFVNGYYVPDFSPVPVSVIIWKGSEGDNIHCTKFLGGKVGETTKS